MTRALFVLAAAALVACQDAGGPAGFDVDVSVVASGTTSCLVTWVAGATDPARVVTYTVYSRYHVPTTQETQRATGQFTDQQTVQFTITGNQDAMGVWWLVSAGGFSEDKYVDFSCGATWNEP